MKLLKSFLLIFMIIAAMKCISDSLTLKIDDMIREFRAQDRFSGTVMVAHEGREIFYQGFGYYNREENITNTPDKPLKIGSIVKDFTAVLILQLNEHRKLNLDDTIGKYISLFDDEINRKITIRHLLRHESGFGDYLMLASSTSKLSELKSVDKIIELFKDQPLLFEPGTDVRYSNSGYTVLGAIIESISGKSYFETVKEQILTPLNMIETYFDWQEIAQFKYKPQWYLRSATGRFLTSPFGEWPSPSGGAYSTGRDLLKFENSLLQDNRLLSDESKVLLATRFEKKPDKTWADINAKSDQVLAKAGGSPGSNAVIINDLGRKYTIIVLANYDEPIAEIIGKNIHSLIQGKTYQPPEKTIFEYCLDLYLSEGTEVLQNNFPEIIRKYDFQDPPDFILNRVGYDLLNEELIDQAIGVLTLNATLFPDIANTWDSLGEAYMHAGKVSQAEEYYKKSLQLNPQNYNALEILEQLNQSTKTKN
jgi:CubicO group peptidase (beta-lactamase class C family)